MTEPAKANWDSYSRINSSQRWRRQSAALGRHFTEAIVAEARVERGMRVLDVASGTGEPAISIAALMQGTGRVVATDVSPKPLELAIKRAEQRGLTNIEVAPMDAHRLDFPDATFDRVTCRLGVMFFADPPRALREVHRVLRPGGRASFLAWGPWQQPYFETTIGSILRVLPEASLPASGLGMFKYAAPGTLTAALRDAGFTHVEERVELTPWNWPGAPEDLWEYFQEVTVPFKPLFDAVPAKRRAAVRAAVIEAMNRYCCDGEIKFTAHAVMASAIR